MVKALQQQPLMRVAYADFEELITSCRGAFKAWDDAMDSFRSLLRTMALKKKDASFGTSSLPVRTNAFCMVAHGDRCSHSFCLQPGVRTAAKFEHHALQARLEQLQAFRRQHEQLRQVVGRVLRGLRG